ncbi:unnamed protein product [Triticum turgidum subsp. durum]|uniref:ELMO domain-containing protein n=1 Tax=Triticum turgidum subsp. durum TaxID=4567 RepID=A0A9R0Y3A0_TRITD|nr:unnamed protein product [Triticum turgidum subsp. durum]
MDANAGSFVAVRRLAGSDRAAGAVAFHHSSSENDRAFDILYCITFKLMDQQWLDMHATYMDFNKELTPTALAGLIREDVKIFYKATKAAGTGDT